MILEELKKETCDLQAGAPYDPVLLKQAARIIKSCWSLRNGQAIRTLEPQVEERQRTEGESDLPDTSSKQSTETVKERKLKMPEENDRQAGKESRLDADAFEREITTDLDEETPDKPKGLALHTRILIGLAVGVVAGLAVNWGFGGEHGRGSSLGCQLFTTSHLIIPSLSQLARSFCACS